MPNKSDYLGAIARIVDSDPSTENAGGNVQSYSGTGPWCEEIRSNAMVVGNQNSQALWNNSDAGPYEALSKTSSENRYLLKLADFNTKIPRIGLGISGASLAVSLANYHNSSITARANQDKLKLEHKSLRALNDINKTLTPAQMAPSPVNTNRGKI